MFLDPRTVVLCVGLLVMLTAGAWIVTRNGPLYFEPPREPIHARAFR